MQNNRLRCHERRDDHLNSLTRITILGIHQRPEKRIPIGNQPRHTESSENGKRVRNNDTPIDAPIAKPIDMPGFLKFPWKTQEELAKQKSRKAAKQTRNNQAL